MTCARCILQVSRDCSRAAGVCFTGAGRSAGVDGCWRDAFWMLATLPGSRSLSLRALSATDAQAVKNPLAGPSQGCATQLSSISYRLAVGAFMRGSTILLLHASHACLGWTYRCVVPPFDRFWRLRRPCCWPPWSALKGWRLWWRLRMRHLPPWRKR